MEERYEVLKAMNTLAKSLNNEGFYYHHWIYIIPDCCDDEELHEIAEEDIETFQDACKCFMRHFNRYATRGGLYVNGEAITIE